jgi:hypothetical protein
VRDAMDAAVSGANSTGRVMPTRTAKSCGPDTPTLVSSLAEVFRGMTVAKKPGHRGEHEGSRKTIARGKPG